MATLISSIVEENLEEQVFETADFHINRSVSQKRLDEILQKRIRQEKEKWLE